MKEKIFDNGEYRIVDVADSQPTRENVYVEIEVCKAQLSATDYQAIKHSEGLISEEDYAPIKAQRQALRDRINDLEKLL